MRVRYVGKPDQGLVVYGEDAMRLDAEYDVLEIYSQADGGSYFRVEPIEHEAPPLFDVRLFVVTSPLLPDNWEVGMAEDGSLTIGPPEWQVVDFWEAYLNGEQWALAAYAEHR